MPLPLDKLSKVADAVAELTGQEIEPNDQEDKFSWSEGQIELLDDNGRPIPKATRSED
jgi:hypothetical protein